MQGTTGAAYLKASFKLVSGHTQRMLRTQGTNVTGSIRPSPPADPKDVSLSPRYSEGMLSDSLNVKWAHAIQSELQTPNSRFCFEVTYCEEGLGL